MGNWLVPLALFGWIPAIVIMFMVLPPKRAVIVAFLGAWMFLPIASYQIKGLPDYTKVSATCAGVFLATSIFDARRFLALRPAWYDLVMLVWCFVPMLSAQTAGLGLKEGITFTINQAITYGMPYLIGRMYFNDIESLRQLAVAVFIAGLVYVPLCLYESRFAPMLHIWVYGYHQHDFHQARRGGWWRPTVFMQHGLAVATFMCNAALLGFWVWRSKSTRPFFGLPLWIPVLVLMGTALLCRSTGAAALMVVGIAVLLSTRVIKLSLGVFALACVPILYPILRTVGGLSSRHILELVAYVASPRAVESLRFRLYSEDGVWYLVQPWLIFGTGRYQWAETSITEGGQRIIPDGLWMITLAKNGVVGLSFFILMGVLPTILFLWRFRTSWWKHPAVGAAAAWAVVAALWMVDNLANAMVNPIFLLAMGGLIAAMPAPQRRRATPHPVARDLRPVMVTGLGDDAAPLPPEAPRPVGLS
jgi:hypothetical protein